MNATTGAQALMTPQRIAGSFRDPSGFLFQGADGQLYRQVNRRYQHDFQMLHDSGLYGQLVGSGRLVDHELVEDVEPLTDEAFCIIRPRRIPFISYPYEWAFSALKDAALLTLDIQLKSLAHEMQLKDATAYNIQFEGCRPVLIDTLSFERYVVDAPWKAYGQFCRHFLAPLALMAKTHIDLGYLARDFIDGIPLDVASSMLPWRTKLSLGMQLHVHWHARMIAKHSATRPTEAKEQGEHSSSRRRVKMPKNRLIVYLENLRGTVKSLTWAPQGTEWADYYEDNSYSQQAFQQKQQLVASYLRRRAPATVWDLGANTGVFSRLAAELGCYTCAFDIDPACVERAYLEGRKQKQPNVLPLRMDLTNPSPSLGWAHGERDSLAARGPADVVMALALIHHLAISNNVGLAAVAEYLSTLGNSLIVEFVPKQDPQVQRLLQNREDIFDKYDQASFEQAFQQYFNVLESTSVGTDGRVLYQMQSRQPNSEAPHQTASARCEDSIT
jgi:Methyltransferase domain